MVYNNIPLTSFKTRTEGGVIPLKSPMLVFTYGVFTYTIIFYILMTYIPKNLIDGYNFGPLNHPSRNKRGGVGIFYNDNLPLKIRKDLSFNECLVSEVLIGKRKVFYSVYYRSPSMKANTPEFEKCLAGFENLYSNISMSCSYDTTYNLE